MVPSSPPESLETRIGSRGMLYTGILALIVGVSCFVQQAIDNGWLTPAAQVLIGGALGIALVLAGSHVVRIGYRPYGQVVTAGAVVVLYVSTFGAFNVYSLISWPAACALLMATTALAALLAHVQDAQGLALIAIGGGFATPFLVGLTNGAQVPLFTYDAVLVAGTMFVSRRHAWPALNLTAYLLTIATFLWWAAQFYRPDQFLTTEAYLVLLCGMFLRLLSQGREATQPFAIVVWLILCSAPVVFHLASLAILDPHDLLFVVYLGAFSTAGALLARQVRSGLVLSGVCVLVGEPLLVWASDHATGAWLLTGLVAVVVTYAVFLVATLSSRVPRALIHITALCAAAETYLLLDGVLPGLTGIATAMWAALQISAALAVRDRRPRTARHFVAVGVALFSVAIALQFDGLAMVVGWAAEGAAIAWLGCRDRSDWWRRSGVLLFLAACVRLVALQATSAAADQPLLLNRRAACGLFVIALSHGLAWLYGHDAGRKPARVAMFRVLANVLTLTLLTSEIEAYLCERPTSLRELALSLTWISYATALALIGIWKQYAPIRHLAIVVFCLASIKIFVVDLAQLDQLYRVTSVAALGVMLLATSFCYYRYYGHVAPA